MYKIHNYIYSIIENVYRSIAMETKILEENKQNFNKSSLLHS